MYPIKTYLDIADETYTVGQKLGLEERRDWARLIVRDSNTVGKDYLLLRVSHNMHEHAGMDIDGQTAFCSIRMHKGQVKRLIKALQKFVDEAEGK